MKNPKFSVAASTTKKPKTTFSRFIRPPAAVVVNLIATVLKFGDRTQIGAVHLATSLVADLQLIGAALAFGYAEYVSSAGMNEAWTASVVSLSGGALLANIVSVVLLVVETVSFHRG